MTEPIRCQTCHGQREELTTDCPSCGGTGIQECWRCDKPAVHDRQGRCWCHQCWQRECLDRAILCPECGNEHICPNCDNTEPATGKVVWLNNEHTAHARLCHRCEQEEAD